MVQRQLGAPLLLLRRLTLVEGQAHDSLPLLRGERRQQSGRASVSLMHLQRHAGVPQPAQNVAGDSHMLISDRCRARYCPRVETICSSIGIASAAAPHLEAAALH